MVPATLAHPELGSVSVWPVANRVGESPAWHPQEQALYWIDVRAPEVLRLEPTSGHLQRWRLPDVVGALAFAGPHTAWIALRQRVAEFDLRSGLVRDIAAVEPDVPTNRLNDGKASPSGKWFVFGSMDDRPTKSATGGLYRLGRDGRVEHLFHGLVVANGIAFDADGTSLFFSDSSRGLLMRASWNEAEGRMGSPSLLATLTDEIGRPDGACMDVEGCYWSAGVSAGVLNRITPEGRIVRSVPLPCRAPTMPCHGGTDAATLFVTSLVRPHWTEAGQCDGALLSFKAPVAGATRSAHGELRTGPGT